MDTKTCTKCGETKVLSAFTKNKSKRGGLQSHCKACTAAESAAWRAANRDKIKAQYAANPGKFKAKNRAGNAKQREGLTPSYIAHVLRTSTKELTPELLELKRQQIELHRLQRQLQATLKDLNHDRRDAEPADQRDLPDLSDLDNG